LCDGHSCHFSAVWHEKFVGGFLGHWILAGICREELEMTIHLLLMVFSLVCLLLASINFPSSRVNLFALGMFFYALNTVIR
jgi:hypothetical protein